MSAEVDLLACIREAQSVIETSMSAMRLARMRIEKLEWALQRIATGDFKVVPGATFDDLQSIAREALGTR